MKLVSIIGKRCLQPWLPCLKQATVVKILSYLAVVFSVLYCEHQTFQDNEVIALVAKCGCKYKIQLHEDTSTYQEPTVRKTTHTSMPISRVLLKVMQSIAYGSATCTWPSIKVFRWQGRPRRG